MSIYEYDQEKHIRLERKAAREEGLEEEREKSKRLAVKMLHDLGIEKETAVLQMMEKYGMERQEAVEFVEQYWTEDIVFGEE